MHSTLIVIVNATAGVAAPHIYANEFIGHRLKQMTKMAWLASIVKAV